MNTSYRKTFPCLASIAATHPECIRPDLLLRAQFCGKLTKLLRTVASLADSDEYTHLKIGSGNVDLDTIGLGWVNDLLFHLVLRPIARLLYGETEGFKDLDWRQGYVAGYSSKPSIATATPRQRLVPHTDDSEVTFNTCLGDDFKGGVLEFSGLRGTEDEGEFLGEFKPRIGTALIHSGRHLHAVKEVTSGDRYAYIIWSRSWRGMRSSICPCCWLHRRQGDKACICSPMWN